MPLSPGAFQAECLAIAQLAFRNNIQLDLRKIVCRKLLQKAMSQVSPLSTFQQSERKKWVHIPFLGTNSYRIAHYIQKLGYSSVSYPLLKSSHLLSLKDITPDHLQCRVYRVVCNAPGCGATYIGQMGRTMADRIKGS